MKNDFEQLLKKVAIPVGRDPAGLGWLVGLKSRIKKADFRKRVARMRLVKALGAVVLIAAMAVIVAGFGFGGSEGSLKIDKAKRGGSFDEELTATIGELMVLPDEIPIVATVADPGKLAGHAFFRGAKKGDKVLIFREADRAILYDAEGHKIVNAGRAGEIEDVMGGEEKEKKI